MHGIYEGRRVQIGSIREQGGRLFHLVSGATAEIVSDRRSGVEVELTSGHGPYSKGARFVVARRDLVLA